MFAEGIVGEGTRVGSTTIGETTDTHGDERVDVGDRQLLHLLVQLLDEPGPIVQADLENLAIVDLADSDKVEMGVSKVILVGKLLDELKERNTLVYLHGNSREKEDGESIYAHPNGH
jgi:hypothetical protein